VSLRPWRIEHGPGWLDSERREFEELARAKEARSVDWHSDPGLGAGLRIRAEGVCLDATIAGLLAQRERIEAMFLAEYLARP